jgi:hypothetical protein
MAKLQVTAIGQADLIDFLDNNSDFSFEIQVLNALIKNGFSCEHGGSYIDQATKKAREFDIRATKRFGKRFLRLAVECKNVRPSFPLLISCLPRREDESFHEMVISIDPHHVFPERGLHAMHISESKNIRLTANRSLYKIGQPVGKSCEQVGRTPSGEIICGDSDVYAKWSQALSSAHDLTYLACRDGVERTQDTALSLVFPIVVVPNARLWTTEYDDEGNRVQNPKSVDRCSYFVDLSYEHHVGLRWNHYTISHIEFTTMTGLMAFIDEVCGDEEKQNASFPHDGVPDIILNWKR